MSIPSIVTRRDAVRRLIALTGATFVGAEVFLSGCARTDKISFKPFTPEDIALLDEVGDTIIPPTDSPGAKAAGIGAFMTMIVNDCYSDDLHGVFYSGLSAIEKASDKTHGRTFAALTPKERLDLLNVFEAEQQKYTREKDRTAPPHYFRLMKELTVFGYYSSEIGCTQALRYEERPGEYHGDVPYVKGEKAWFNPTRRVGT